MVKGNKKKLFLCIVVLVLLVAVWTFCRWPRTRWSLEPSAAATAPSQDKPFVTAPADQIRNVLLISIDTCRADHFGCYGYSRNTTPRIDALAAQSTLFNHAVSPIPLTLPAHSSMLTGTTPLYHNVHSNENYKLSDGNITLAEILREKGFETAAVIGAFVLNRYFGLAQGFSTYDDRIAGVGSAMAINEREAADVSDRAIAWLQRKGREKFFLFVHYYDPHIPYRQHKQFRFNVLPGRDLQNDRYDSEIAYTDYHVGRVLDTLAEMKIEDSTLVILTADHGESLGEHGEVDHAYFIYHSTLHVPLIMKIPGQSRPAVINETVGIVDILPTVCGLLGLAPPDGIQGYDLSGLWIRGRSLSPDRNYYAESLEATKYHAASLQALVSQHHKYIHTTRPELYDLLHDPREINDIVKQKSDLAKGYHDRLMTVIEQTDRSDSDSRTPLDDESLQRLAALGYVGGSVTQKAGAASGHDDPKDLIGFHNHYLQFATFLKTGRFVQAKQLLLKLVDWRPRFYSPSQAGMVLVLATNKDPQICDVPAALAIGEHAAESSDYRDAGALYALSAAYAAAERFERAIKIAEIAYDLAKAENEDWRANEILKSILRYKKRKPAEPLKF
jgi:arylsulfatase A-like enzyme